jgi:hypothetical protein
MTILEFGSRAAVGTALQPFSLAREGKFHSLQDFELTL